MAPILLNILALTFAWAVIMTVVVTVHELGHFAVAKLFGVKIDRFSIGIGKTLWSRHDARGTEWRLAAIPIGGYVRFAGDIDVVSSVPDAKDLAELKARVGEQIGPDAFHRYFHFKPLWQRVLIILGGPAANVLFAVVVFTLQLTLFGTAWSPPIIGETLPDGAFARAGVLAGDRIVSMDGQAVDNIYEFSRYVAYRYDRDVTIGVRRGARTLALVARPIARVVPDPILGQPMKVGVMGGVGVGQGRTIQLPPWRALRLSLYESYETVDLTFRYTLGLLRGQEGGDQIVGPLRIALIAKVVAMEGLRAKGDWAAKLFAMGQAVTLLMACLSLNIALMNLAPIPTLDGGHLMFYAYEAVVRRPMAARIQVIAYWAGLGVLVGLLIYATWNDLNLPILKIIAPGFSSSAAYG